MGSLLDGKKQIEEIVKLFMNIPSKLFPEGFTYRPYVLAEALYNAGYRKSSEVAEEIFAEIEEILKAHKISTFDNLYDDVMLELIAELKKKYTEGGE